MRRKQTGITTCAALALGLAAPGARATVQDFSGPPAGTVVAGEEPGGGFDDGTLFLDFTLSVTNHGDGPHSLVIFDSANPSPLDLDLGSPNETCDPPGPGSGVGGEVGQPGENCVPQGGLVIVADNIVDTSPADGLVDEPNDEAGGGLVVLDFLDVVVLENMVLIDIDHETATFELFKGGVLKGTVDASDLGDNSVQTVDLDVFGPISRVELTFSSSGGISSLEYFLPGVPVVPRSWSAVKATFQ